MQPSNKIPEIDKLNDLSRKKRYTEYDGAVDSACRALEQAKKVNYARGIAYAKLNIGICHFLKSDNKLAFPLFKESLSYFDYNTDENGYVDALSYLGNIFESYGEYEKALEHCQKALNIARETKYFEGQGDVLSVIGIIYTRLADYKSAQESFIESLRIREQFGNSEAIASSLNRLGQSYCSSGEFEKALEYYSKSLEIRLKTKKFSAISWTYLGFAITYEGMGNLVESYKYFTKGSSHPEVDIRCKAQCLMGSGRINRKLDQPDLSIIELKEALSIAEDLNAKPLQFEIHFQLAKSFEKHGNVDEALKSYKIFHLLKEEVHNTETSNRLKDQQIVFATEKAEKEKEIFQLRNVELKSALDEIELKNEEITASIRYAERIQSGLLPKESLLKEILPDHFILFLPKDIVSGDFYWAAKVDDKSVIVAADSTGHGVPGSLLSMLGTSFLDTIVNANSILSPASILDNLRNYIIKALKQEDLDTFSRDGMDIAICVYDWTKKELRYAGAFNPLCLIRNGDFEVINADRMPVGIHSGTMSPFKQHCFNINKGDKAYMFSDGFKDQFGGEKGGKLKTVPFHKLLHDTSGLGMAGQKNALFDFFNNWKGKEHQTDDIIVIGIEF